MCRQSGAIEAATGTEFSLRNSAYVRPPGELQTEVEAAGFEVLRMIAVPSSQLALTRGVLLARRPTV